MAQQRFSRTRASPPASNTRAVISKRYRRIWPTPSCRSSYATGRSRMNSTSGIPWGRLRDGAFLVYQTNIIFAAGIVGGPVVVWQLVKRFKRKSWKRTQQWVFWIAFALFCPVVGILVVGERDKFGVAHLTLLALEALALALLADVLARRR